MGYGAKVGEFVPKVVGWGVTVRDWVRKRAKSKGHLHPVGMRCFRPLHVALCSTGYSGGGKVGALCSNGYSALRMVFDHLGG